MPEPSPESEVRHLPADDASDRPYRAAIEVHNAATHLLVLEASRHMVALVEELFPAALSFITDSTLEGGDDWVADRMNIIRIEYGVGVGDFEPGMEKANDTDADAFDQLTENVSEPLLYLAELTEDYRGLVRWGLNGSVEWLSVTDLEDIA